MENTQFENEVTYQDGKKVTHIKRTTISFFCIAQSEDEARHIAEKWPLPKGFKALSYHVDQLNDIQFHVLIVVHYDTNIARARARAR